MTKQKLQIGLIVLIAFLGTFQPFGLDPYLPNIQPIADDFGVSGELIQLTLSAYTLGIAAGVLVAGPLSDAVGRRRPALVALLAFSAASFMTAFASSIEWFFAGRTLQGFFASALLVVGAAMMRDLYTGLLLVRAVGRQMLVQSTSWFIGPFLGSAILYISDFRGLGIGLGIFALPIFVLVWRSLPDTMPLETRQKNTLSELFARFANVFKDRSFNGFVVIQVCINVALFSYLSVAPFVYDGRYGIESNQVGIFLAINSMAAYLGTQIGARLSLKLQPQWVLLLALCVGGFAGIAQMATAQFDWGFVAFTSFIALFTFGFGMSTTPIYALSMVPHPHEAGTAQAMMGMAGMVATSAAGPLYVAVDHMSSIGIGAIMLGFMIVAVIALFAVVQPSKLKVMT